MIWEPNTRKGKQRMKLNKSPRLAAVRDGADAMMRYLERIPAYVSEHGPTDDFDTTVKLEGSQEIASRLRDLVDWTDNHRILAKNRYQEYCRLRDDFEILTGAPSWLPIINEDLQSSIKDDSKTVDLSAIQSNPVTNLQVATVCLAFDLYASYSQLRNSDRQAKREQLERGLDDILDWIDTNPESLTGGRLRQYQSLRDQYEGLTKWLAHATIHYYVWDVDDILESRVSVS